MRLLFISFIVTALWPLASAHAHTEGCAMFMKFDTPQTINDWRAVNDGVMGGKSSGGPGYKDKTMIFEGVINTDGGGFSSVRTDVEPGAFANVSGLKLRVKSDGRAYKITLRADARRRFRRISFQGAIPATPEGEWADVNVPFDTLKASIFGQPVRGAVFNRKAVQEMGIIIADGEDGPFRLAIGSIEICP